MNLQTVQGTAAPSQAAHRITDVYPTTRAGVSETGTPHFTVRLGDQVAQLFYNAPADTLPEEEKVRRQCIFDALKKKAAEMQALRESGGRPETPDFHFRAVHGFSIRPGAFDPYTGQASPARLDLAAVPGNRVEVVKGNFRPEASGVTTDEGVAAELDAIK